MAIDNLMSRRTFIRGLATGLGVLGCNSALGQPFENAAYVGIETAAATNQSSAVVLGRSGQILARIPTQLRAHGLAENHAHIVVFPRRPGSRFAVIDKTSLQITATLTAPQDRHFYGHGAFTRDGAYLLTTENNLTTLQGVIGIYDTQDYRRVAEVPLDAAGPHEVIRSPDSDQFYIAMGGLQTHPDYGRTPFNLSDFQSQIFILDFGTQSVTKTGGWAGSRGISLRHLAVDGLGRLYVGGQVYDAGRADQTQGVWVMDPAGSVCAAEVGAEMGGYVSSVAAGADYAMIASKKSGAVLWLDGCQPQRRQFLDGASAVGVTKGGDVFSGAKTLMAGGQLHQLEDGIEYDNHGLSLMAL